MRHGDQTLRHNSQERFYCFPPFSLIRRCLQKIEMDKGEGIMIVPVLGDPAMVSKDDASVGEHATTITSNNRDAVSSQKAQLTTPTGKQTKINCMQVIGESITK